MAHLKEEYGVGKYKPVTVTAYDRALLFLDLNHCLVEQVEENGFGYTYYISSDTETAVASTTATTDVVFTLTASQSIAAGTFINIFDDSGVSRIRRADATLGYRAHGFVKTAYSVGQVASIYQSGLLTIPSTINIGSEYFLSASGLVTSAPNIGWEFAQRLGVGVGSTSLYVEIEEPYNYT